MSGDQSSEFYELKQKAVRYYEENGVPRKVQEVMNSMFYDNPDDVFGYLANYFSTLAKCPVISRVEAREAIDSKGHPTLQTELFCMVKNLEEICGAAVLASRTRVAESQVEERESEEEERAKSVTAAVQLICEKFSPALRALNPTQQLQADSLIYDILERLKQEEEEKLAQEREAGADPEGSTTPVESKSQPKVRASKSPKGKKGQPAVVIIPDEPKEKLFSGCEAVSVLSQVVCQGAANILHIPLYQHVSSLYHEGQILSKYTIPLPVVAIIGSGKAWPGKLNCVKEFMIVPRPSMAVEESLTHVMKIYNHVAKTVSAKTGISMKNTNELGCLCPALDRPEQGLDMLQDSITASGLTPGEDFHIILNCAAHETFDYDKGKYEVMGGQQKLPEDMVEFWADLLSRYPSINGIIDPVRKQEKEAWMRLCERVSEHCYIMGDHVYHRPGLLKNEELQEDFKTSGVIFRMELMNTVSDITESAHKLKDAGNQIMISGNLGDNADSFISDLAVGVAAKFLCVGAPCHGERTIKLNRLLQIEAELKAKDKLGQMEDHCFPFIKPPTPPASPEATNSTGTASPTK